MNMSREISFQNLAAFAHRKNHLKISVRHNSKVKEICSAKIKTI